MYIKDYDGGGKEMEVLSLSGRGRFLYPFLSNGGLALGRLVLGVLVFGGLVFGGGVPVGAQQAQQHAVTGAQQHAATGAQQHAATGAQQHAGAEEPGFLLQAVELSGVTVFEEEEIRQVYEDALGTEVTFAGLEGIVAGITGYYRDAGFVLARASLPPQTVEEGVVRIDVTEGRYGDIRVTNASSVRDDVVDSMLGPLASGDVIHQPSLDRTLLLLNDLPGVAVRSSLQPAGVGRSDLLVDVGDAEQWDFRVGLDNHGSKVTGAERLVLSGGYNNPFGVGDRLYGTGLITKGGGMSMGRVGYAATLPSLPLELDGSISHVKLQLGDAFASADVNVETTSVDVSVRYPLVRSARRSMYVSGDVTSRNSTNPIFGDKGVFVVEFGVNETRALAGATLGWQADVTFGNLSIRTQDVKDADALGFKTQGGFTKLNGNVQYVRALNERTRLFVSSRAQFAFKNLDDSEKFSLGGSGGVRAYGTGDGSGDLGLAAGVEVTHVPAWTDAWLGNWSVKAFLDGGTVNKNAKPGPNVSDESETLFGAGVGADWAHEGYSVGFDYGCRLGNEAGGSGANETCRLWVQTGIRF